MYVVEAAPARGRSLYYSMPNGGESPQTNDLSGFAYPPCILLISYCILLMSSFCILLKFILEVRKKTIAVHLKKRHFV